MKKIAKNALAMMVSLALIAPLAMNSTMINAKTKTTYVRKDRRALTNKQIMLKKAMHDPAGIAYVKHSSLKLFKSNQKTLLNSLTTKQKKQFKIINNYLFNPAKDSSKQWSASQDQLDHFALSAGQPELDLVSPRMRIKRSHSSKGYKNTQSYRNKLSREIDKLAKEDSQEYAPGYYPSKSHKKAEHYFRHMKWVTKTLFQKENELSKLIYSHLKYESKRSPQGKMNFLRYDMMQLQGQATIDGDRREINPHLSKAQNHQLNINNFKKKQEANQLLSKRWSKDAKQLRSLKLAFINKSIKKDKKLLKIKRTNHAKIYKNLTKEYKALKSTKRMNVTEMPISILA